MKKNKPYFNEDLQSRIREMTEDQQNALLLDLEGTPYWTAILRYLQARTYYAQNGLATTDAVKEAGKICQLQGLMLGLSDLQSMVIALKERADRNELPDDDTGSFNSDDGIPDNFMGK